ncbi:hypothetical protein CLHOM_07360 [Clostridium homopropionicum DSM 5847]|uniref:SLAP domain-containing protein n=1 Tax=Clostridium homopropionicum DSM 5847 TaxID=1121318 RepID=A0A0L6ZC83_9CLOT|nr:SLAP domain-containing protein [Clostridium homopropionicum]KOA20594.1 hypothetical protein CLHOM_07360 [Clostridium homopropionicum DSM 5847]SFF93586.1 SLAP domain-containing protein [Clostridium homopropionicum]
MAKFIDKFFGNSKKSELNTSEKSYINLEAEQTEKNVGQQEETIMENSSDEENTEANSRKVANLDLSLNAVMETTVSDFQREFIKEELDELPPVLEGDINIATTYIFDMEDKFEAGIYIRNGLDKPVNLELVPLNIIDKENNIVATKVFNFKELGLVPPMSARPWKLYFEKEIVKVETLNKDDFQIVFDMNIQARETVDIEIENIPENINSGEKQKYMDFLNRLPAIAANEFSISTYNLSKDQEGNLEIILLIRNGNINEASLEKLPIKIITENGQDVVEGVFDLQGQAIKVSPRKAVLHRFIFPSNSLLIEEFDISKCKVIFSS